ncbi:MAG: LuxR C-terminal-related transcriptional regulator [Pseudomonadota bacterium]
MKKTILLYALALAVGAVLLQWMEHQYAIRLMSTELYVMVLAVGFTVLGVWVGHRLTRGPRAADPTVNRKALDALKISDKEYEVLELLAAGHSNREMADRLFVSPNTIKTHLASLYRKLEVSRRTQAVSRARELNLIV